MKHIIIMNSSIQKRKKYTVYQMAKSLWKSKDHEIIETHDQRHAQKIAEKYSSGRQPVRLYACGGDGTLHQIINGIADFSCLELAILPLGTGNDTIKSFRPLQKKDFLDLRRYQKPKAILCDLLDVNGELSLNTVSLGLDVRIAQEVSSFRKAAVFGSAFPYYMGLLKSMLHPLHQHYRLQIDGKLYENDYTFIVCGNGQYYGGGYRPAPQASMQDGYMDICLIKKVSRAKILSLSHQYKLGTHLEHTELATSVKGKRMELLAPRCASVNADGEILQCDDLVVSVSDRKIKLLLPTP